MAVATSVDLQVRLKRLAELLPSAVSARANVRRGLKACWPTKPSMRALDRESRALFDAGMRMEGDPWHEGKLYLAIDAAIRTLELHGHQLPAGSELPRWSMGKVDRAAQLTPSREAADALRSAIEEADDARDAICHVLDEVTRLAPPESFLPEWSQDDARAYIGAVKWRHARPNQPPHEYTIRDWLPDRQREFVAFAQLIQSTGVLKTWGDRVRAYLEIEGFDYWTMGARVTETTVINRAPITAPGAAKPLSSLAPEKLARAIDYALEYRRVERDGDPVVAGRLGQRLRDLISPPDPA